ncbi:MAG TPA: DUF3325 domain-containing protein [Limnobacter sp.]|nr:DUF3325 domain-containing protein [Limnobacter sp.]
MLDALFLSMAAVLSMLGMAWLALSMEVHWAQVKQIALAQSSPPAVQLRCLACIGLLMSLGACLLADRPSIAVLVWIMLMVGSAVAVAMQLSKFPKLLRLFWPVGER